MPRLVQLPDNYDQMEEIKYEESLQPEQDTLDSKDEEET
jgi:hypothetical protein